MRIHVTEDKEVVEYVRKALKENEGFCPCVFESHGKEQYRCLCEDFRLHKKAGEACHCGLYIKDED